MSEEPRTCALEEARFGRRRFLFGSTATLVTVMLPRWPWGGPLRPVRARMAGYERRRIGRLSALRLGQPLEFAYPYDHPGCRSLLVKLGVPAGGGVGPDGDVVAFNAFCTHQGGPLAGKYQASEQMLGPCPFHLTTFDLTRHGMVVSGHATEGLPQVLLEVEGDEIYAIGMLGLIFGFHDNRVAPA